MLEWMGAAMMEEPPMSQDSISKSSAKDCLQPAALWDARGTFSQVVVPHGTRRIIVSGQVALDREQNLVGPGNLEVQARQAFTNLKLALAAAGAAPVNVVKITTFVVGYKPTDRPAIQKGMEACFGSDRSFASTLLGVASLAREGLLIEVEAEAAV